MESEHLPKIGKLARTARRLDFIVYGPHFRFGIFVFGYCYVGHLCTFILQFMRGGIVSASLAQVPGVLQHDRCRIPLHRESDCYDYTRR